MYFPENLEELERIKTECMQLVQKRALLSGVAAAVPLPGVDISADITIMVELLTEINKRFGLSEEQLSQMDLERKKVLLVIISSATLDATAGAGRGSGNTCTPRPPNH